MKENVEQINNDYKVTIPVAIKKFLNLKHSDHVIFKMNDNKVIFEKYEPTNEELFNDLTEKVEERFQELNIDYKDIEIGVKWIKKIVKK